MNKKLILTLIIAALSITIMGCSSKTSDDSSPSTTIESTENSDDNKNITLADATATISLSDTTTIEGDGAEVENNIVTINTSGVYAVSGTLNDGQIIIDTSSEENVYLIFNGTNITSSTNAPIYVKQSKNTIIILEEGTENQITDAKTYIYPDSVTDEPNAAIFSKDDLTIKGTGSLTVNANYNNGIASKDDLKISNGNIIVNAVADGLRGKDSIIIKGGNITINAGGDGIKSNNDTETDKGYISIENGTINITAGEDGIQAETNLKILDGALNINTGGGSSNSSTNIANNDDRIPWGNWGMQNNSTSSTDTTTSAKGIKAGVNITIENGVFTMDSSDDSIHSNDSIVIDDGDFIITSGDDGIHSDISLEINGGTIDITKSYEGIESANIKINDGNIHVISSDDGLNAAGGNDGSSVNGRAGQNAFSSSSTGSIEINSGYVVVNASGDGIDANGNIIMNDGTVIVNGPTNNGNGSLDYDETFDIKGGLLVAAGSSGMVQAPSNSSSQNSINLTLSSQSAGNLVHIKSENGEEILTFAPASSYQSIVVSSPKIKSETTYVAYTGGSSTGTPIDGLYSDGSYSPGTEITSFTASSVITNASQSGISTGANKGGFGGMKGGR